MSYALKHAFLHIFILWGISIFVVGTLERWTQNKRKTIRIKAQMPNVQSLKVFQDLMPNFVQRKFTLKYERILYLLGVPCEVGGHNYPDKVL